MRRPKTDARYSIIQGDADREITSLAEAVRESLTAMPRSIPCRFLYDEVGSQLFEEICALPEYYLTRAEREILEACAGEVAAGFAGRITLAELGSGSAAKTRLLIEAFLGRHGGLRYVPVDISRSILEESALSLAEHYRGLEIRAIAGEYEDGLRHVRSENDRPKLIAWLGSNVGNLTRAEAARFLRRVRAAMAPSDRLLMGVDLRKDPAVLERAYDDARGVTARFSLNLLRRINRELAADFEPTAFAHRAVYHEVEGRVAIHLVSRRSQRVGIDALGIEIALAAGEAIHVEDSYKYAPEEIDALAGASGMRTERRWLDAGERFSLNLFAPEP